MAGDAHRPRLLSSKELVARVSGQTAPMRERSRQQRADVVELRRRRAQVAPAGRRIERLWPSFVLPADPPTSPARRPAGGPLVLVCGVCDEVLVEDASPEVAVLLRCPCCLAYNVRKTEELL